ncbi:hypothetical protein QBC45DRAFT_417182 [Copromyces sp. CBS 386.78]|nr:hypothetical protein QBC45DRAFT_417182 [Copromyces sp. CBS 386.78]
MLTCTNLQLFCLAVASPTRSQCPYLAPARTAVCRSQRHRTIRSTHPISGPACCVAGHEKDLAASYKETLLW